MSISPESQRTEKIVSLCKRRGFIFQSSEIYGGLNGVWDYGPLGVELKCNLKNYWWRVMVHERDDVVGMDGAILTHPAVLKASGHMEGFSDPMVDCLVTGKRFRADQIEPQTGRMFSFAGAVDYTSAEMLNRERTTPERSTIWSRIDLAPHLRQVFDNFSYHSNANNRSGYIFLTGDVREQLRALGVLVSNKLFTATSFDIYSAIDVTRSSELSSGTRVNPAIRTAQEFYRKRGISDPVVIMVGFRDVENTQDYNPENGSLLTEPRPFNLMFKTSTGSVDARLTSTLVSIGSPLGATGPTAGTQVPDMHVAIGSAPDVSGTTGTPIGQSTSITKGQVADVRRTTAIGEDEAASIYLRPETAQSIFVQFKNVLETSRKKLPFGIAQIGKAFRNEINPRNFTFRSREFEQMELEYFCRAEEGMKWLDYWLEERLKFYENIGIPREHLHVRTVPDDERAFYSKGTYDIEYDFPFGRQELEGVAYRTHYDLSQHQKASGKSLEYFDDETKQRFIPNVVEPSAGVDRTILALICEAYSEDKAPNDKGEMEARIVLRFHPRMAPIKCAVFPLLKNKEPLVVKAKEIVDLLRPHMYVFYDESGAIGRRYRRQDEIGTPFCVTVDFETLGEKEAALRDTVTLRERDSMKQERVEINDLLGTLTSRIR